MTVTTANDNAAVPPTGSLRWAITNANAQAGVDTIAFNISGTGPFTNNLVAPLPAITKTLTIDGTTQPGYAGKPRIELNGANAGDPATGIYLLASNCVVKGLAIDRFSNEAIRIESFGGNVIQANFIGTGVYGTNSFGNGNGASGFGGITILSASNLIGGLNATNRNIISGSNFHGIWLLNSTATGNQIQGNYIGLDVTGTKRLGNVQNGISIAGAKGNLVGGTNGGARNVISGNYESGVYILGGNSASNLIQGNFIGTGTNGTVAISNAADGVTLNGGVGNAVGGTIPASRNIISGNGGRGVGVFAGGTGNLIQGNYIGTDVNGTNKLANAFGGVEINGAPGNTVGGTVNGAGNVISGNSLSGVYLNGANATANAILGNFIGTDVNGTNALGNTYHGVFISGISNNVVGGTAAGARNLISGNLQNGVYIADINAVGNQVQGNFIGTDVTGLRGLGNALSGVRIEASGNSIGGLTAPTRNIISGNANNGVYLLGNIASNNIVQGNYLGTAVNGTSALANANAGVVIDTAAGNLIGGTVPGARNLISGNLNNGVYIAGAAATGNVVQGNYIGTDVTGTIAVANGLALPVIDIAGGVDISGAPSNTIGGAVAGAGNLISGNLRDAIAIGDAGASGNVIQGNWVGVQADGVSPLGNEWHGVEIRNSGGGSNTVIGAVNGGANVLAYATLGQRSGVRIRTAPGNIQILVRGNSIFANGGSSYNGFGIDLDTFGVNANDVCDTDTGANMLQNSPVLTNASSSGSGITVSGWLNSMANTTYLLQFYANAITNGNVEGQTYLGDAYVTTGADCTSNYAFTASFTNAVPLGQFITATATDPTNNTSELSAPVASTSADILPMNIAVTPGSIGANGTVTVSLTVTNQGNAAAGATTTRLVINSSSTGEIPGDPVLADIATPAIAAGGFVNLSTNLNVGSTTGTRYIWVILDYFSAITQSNYTNDIAPSPALTVTNVTFADILPINIAITPNSTGTNGTVTVSFTVTNQGNATVGATTTRLVINSSSTGETPGDPVLADIATPAIAAGGFVNLSTNVNVGSTMGTRYVWVNLDYFGAITQSNNANDIAHSPALTVTISPTLFISFLSASNRVSLSWTSTISGFVLRQTPSLTLPIVWSTVTNVVVVYNQFGTNVVVTAPMTATNQFYRLLLQ